MMPKIVNLVDVIRKAIVEKNVKSFLDVGCGYGGLIKAVHANAPWKLRCVGIDIAKPYIEFASRESHGVDFQLGDIRKLPFADKEFDLIFTLGVFIHVPKRQIKKAIKEAMRVGKRGMFLESSVKTKEKPKKKYNPKDYWTRRAGRTNFAPEDKGVVYYFAHDYAKIFDELGFKWKAIDTDKETNTRLYLIWR